VHGEDVEAIDWGAMLREVLRTGTVAGLAMIPFAMGFRASGLRINEYGRKTLDLIVGDVAPALDTGLMFVQHMVISWIAALPLLLVLPRLARRRDRLLAGLAYGAGFYVVMNSLALPIAFGDPTPWQLGFSTIYPSLFIHVVYGVAIAWMARPGAPWRNAAAGPDR
jgi:hypothetical protein